MRTSARVTEAKVATLSTWNRARPWAFDREGTRPPRLDRSARPVEPLLLSTFPRASPSAESTICDLVADDE